MTTRFAPGMVAPANGLVVYNTLTRKKEPFVPQAPPHVGMYVCGLTVYDYAHIGHARTAVAFETIRRWLHYRGYEVTFVQNVTDVDDKIIDRANELKVDAQAHAAKWTQICNDDMTHLGVSMPDVQPKVTEHIPHIVRLIERLEARGFAYMAPDGSVYYRVAKKQDYGKLSNRSAEEMKSGARVDPAEGKEDPKDFALWKSAKPGEPSWDSPWGKGRPGWHIECSAMSLAYLGETFDIHGGGLDLVFPHHENEVAQSEGATGKPFVKYWLHSGFLTVNGEKMSKSLKNFITIQDMLKTREPEAVRFFYANTHYRSGIDYSPGAFDDATRGLERLRRLHADLDRVANGTTVGPAKADERLIQATATLERDFGRGMDDDFNTREAVGALFQFVTDVNKALSEGAGAAAAQLGRSVFLRLARVLTLFPQTQAAAAADDVGGLMDLFIRLREELRKKKDFQLSDLVRDELARVGYEVADGKQGAKWRRKT
jgi:cysteinyl-tRNA synthetase